MRQFAYTEMGAAAWKVTVSSGGPMGHRYDYLVIAESASEAIRMVEEALRTVTSEEPKLMILGAQAHDLRVISP